MNFSLRFQGIDRTEISGTSFRRIGLYLIKMIREKANCPRLDLNVIQGWINPEPAHSLQIVISEETACSSGLFAETNEVEILVPESGLKNFYFIETKIQRNDINDIITAASVTWVLDEENLIAEWEKAGFPINWNPED